MLDQHNTIQIYMFNIIDQIQRRIIGTIAIIRGKIPYVNWLIKMGWW